MGSRLSRRFFVIMVLFVAAWTISSGAIDSGRSPVRRLSRFRTEKTFTENWKYMQTASHYMQQGDYLAEFNRAGALKKYNEAFSLYNNLVQRKSVDGFMAWTVARKQQELEKRVTALVGEPESNE